MTTTVHKNLTGADLHEPKGADSAASGQVYVSNGSGSGVWTTASSLVTAGGFTTGNTKFTYGGVEAGWILCDDGSIGDGSSGATNRANSDTSALYTVLWAIASTTISGGKGISAAADFAAHKPLTLPPVLSRVLGVAGSGSGLTTRNVGGTVGTETVTLSASNIPSGVPVSVTGSVFLGSGNLPTASSWNNRVTTATGGDAFALPTSAVGNVSSLSGSMTGTTTTASQTAVSLMQPSAFLNMLIKL